MSGVQITVMPVPYYNSISVVSGETCSPAKDTTCPKRRQKPQNTTSMQTNKAYTDNRDEERWVSINYFIKHQTTQDSTPSQPPVWHHHQRKIKFIQSQSEV